MVKLLNCYIVKNKLKINKPIDLKIQQSNNPPTGKVLLGMKQYIFIPIMYGCNNFCSYCAVPYTRGREISRSEKEILSEIKSATKASSDKIMLLGQNVNSYSFKASLEEKSGSLAPLKIRQQADASIKRTSFFDKRVDKLDFIGLLNKIEKFKSVKEITFMTSHPKDMSEELIDWMAKSKKFSRELHLPLQSGDNEILKRMNRHYNVNHFIKIIYKIRNKISAQGGSAFGGKNLYLSTDIIVGFPGETQKQFENTLNVCKKIGFDKAYVSQYSPRPGTIAAKMADDVSPAEKKHRWKILDNLINKKG